MTTELSTSRLDGLIQTDGIKKRFNEVLKERAPQFMSSVLSLSRGNKALESCDPMSVLSAAMIAATLDLPITPSLGQAYIVPYGGVAQFQIGWKGYVQLALRTGKYKLINAVNVKEGQLKKHNSFTGEYEFQEEATSETVIGYLSYFKLSNGYEHWFYMTKEEVEKHAKRYSKMYQAGKGRWIEDFDGQARKTVTKLNLSKYGLLSVEMQKALQDDEAIDIDGTPSYPDNPTPELPASEPQAPKTTSTRLKQAIGVPPMADEDRGETEEQAQIPL
jgi:recombination protein RecT